MEKEKKDKESEGSSQNRDTENLLHRVFFSKYKTIKKIGEGSFGKIYEAEFNSEYYALKFESRSKGQDLLETEAKIMSYLKGPNIPLVKSYGYSGDYNILVMQLLGKSLDNLIEIKKKFTIKTVCLLAYQMISVLEYIHNRHIIHRDIKPDNFVMGVHAKNAMLYILDFGLAKKYRSSTTLEQYPMVNKKKLTGTARYASINALSGLEQSRRDDLEAVGYVLMYFLRGSLPWQGLKLKSKEDRYKKILEKKKETSSSDLCAGYPVQFKDFIDYTRRLEYTEEPNYDMLKDSFYNLVVEEMGEKFDYVYDWTTQEDLDKRKKGSGGLSDVGSIIASESKGNASVVFTPKIRKNRSDMTKSNGNTMTIYKSTRSDVNQKIITDSRGGASDKVETKCCMM